MAGQPELRKANLIRLLTQIPGYRFKPLVSEDPKFQWQTLKNPIDRITEITFATERIKTIASSGNVDLHTTNTGYEAMTPIK